MEIRNQNITTTSDHLIKTIQSTVFDSFLTVFGVE